MNCEPFYLKFEALILYLNSPGHDHSIRIKGIKIYEYPGSMVLTFCTWLQADYRHTDTAWEHGVLEEVFLLLIFFLLPMNIQRAYILILILLKLAMRLKFPCMQELSGRISSLNLSYGFFFAIRHLSCGLFISILTLTLFVSTPVRCSFLI